MLVAAMEVVLPASESPYYSLYKYFENKLYLAASLLLLVGWTQVFLLVYLEM